MYVASCRTSTVVPADIQVSLSNEHKSQTESLQFSVNSSFMKIFNTKSMNVVSECLDMFNVSSVADYIVKRKCKFLTGYINSQNSLCNLLCRTAKKDLSDMTLR